MRERLWRIRLWGYDKHFPKVRELFPKVRDLFCLIKELCGQVGDLWRELHAVSAWAGEADLSGWKSRNRFWKCSFRARIYTACCTNFTSAPSRMLFSRARIYGFYFPKKVFTPSHSTRFLLIFSGFECEGLDFKVFTRTVNACERWKKQAFTR